MDRALENREKIKDIRKRMNSGQITREEAKKEAAPIIDEINTRAEQLAKKFKMRATKVNFIGLMR